MPRAKSRFCCSRLISRLGAVEIHPLVEFLNTSIFSEALTEAARGIVLAILVLTCFGLPTTHASEEMSRAKRAKSQNE